MSHARRIIVGFLAALVIAGCGEATSDGSLGAQPSAVPTTTPATAATTPPLAESPDTVVADTEETTVAPSPGIDPAMQPIVDQAVADLASRLNIDVAAIETVSAEAKTWPDKSLGCPQPGMVYNQVTVDGALIELKAAGASYSYHSGGSQAPFLCQ